MKNDPLGLFTVDAQDDPLGLFSEAPKKQGFELGTALKSGVANVGNMADTALSTLAGSAAALVGDSQEAIAIDEARRDRAQTRQRWANPTNRDLSFGEKIASTVGTLPLQIVASGLSPADTAQKAIDAGETTGKALGAAAIDAVGNAAGVILPGWKEGSLLTRAATGAAANAAQDYATKAAIKGLLDTEQGKKQFTPSFEDAAVAGIVGGASASALGKSAPKKGKSNVDLEGLTKDLAKSADSPKPNAPEVDFNSYASLAQYKQRLLSQKQTPEVKQELAKVNQEITRLNTQAVEAARREKQLASESMFNPDAYRQMFERKSNETEQMPLFDQPEMVQHRQPAQAEFGDWRIDENGMPIKADLSLELQNLQQPLQRNLWGDEQLPKNEQEQLGITHAMDATTDPQMRAQQQQLLNGEIEAPGNLKASIIEANQYTSPEVRSGNPSLKQAATRKGQGGYINPEVFKEGFEKIKDLGNGIRLFLKNDPEWGLRVLAVDQEGDRVGEVALDAVSVGGRVKAVNEATNNPMAHFLTSDSTWVDPKLQRQGLASEMYNMIAEAGNDILPSKSRTEDGKKMWAGFEQKGLTTDGYIKRKTPFGPKGQRGAIDPDLLTLGFSKLFHGGKEFKKWEPGTVGKGEGMRALGPGLYASDTKNVADLYTKYGTIFDINDQGDLLTTPGVLSELAVDTSKIINPRHQNPNLSKAVENLDKLGLKASDRGIIGAMNHAQTWGRGAEARTAVTQAGIDGFWIDLPENQGKEVVIFNPEVIAQVSRADTPVEKSNITKPWGPKNQQGYILFGKNQPAFKKLTDKLGIEGILGEIAPSDWTVDKAIEVASKAKDVDQNVLQKLNNVLTKGGLYQALKTHNPLVRFTVEKVLKADQLTRADIRDYVHRELGPAMRDLSNQEQADVWAAISIADLHQKELSPEQLAKYGFNEKQMNLVRTHRQVMDYALDQMDKARAAARKAPVTKRVAYAAMRSSGDFRRLVWATDEDGTKSVVGVLGSNFRWKTNQLAEQMKAKGLEVGPEMYFGGVPSQRNSANQAFMEAVQFLAENDPNVQKFIDILHDIRTQEAYNFMNAKKHTMAKKGIEGMEGRKAWQDAERNAYEGLQAQLDYAEMAIKWGHMSDAVNDIKKVLSSDKINMPEAKQWAEDYMYNALGFNPSQAGRALEQSVAFMFKNTGVGYSVPRQAMAAARKATNTVLLGLNPAFWATNVLQPLQAMPGMKAYLVSKGLDASFDFGTGYSYLAQGSLTSMKQALNSGLDAFDKAAIAYADKHHVYGSDLVEHSNRARKDVGYYTDRVGNLAAGAIENTSRRVMFYGFAHMLKQNGMDVKNGLFEAAHNLTDMAMNNYSMVERPPVYNALGPIGDMAANLASYKHNEFSRLALFARQIGENKAARPLLVQLATSVMAAGVTGVVGFAEADWLYKQITRAMGEPDSLTAAIIRASEGLGEAVGGGKHVLSHGIFSLMGVDMSKRLGLSDALPNSLGEAVFPGGSKLVDIGSAAVNAVRSPTEMNAKRLVREASPGIATGMLDRAWFSKDTPKGELTSSMKTGEGGVYRNEADKAWKTMGFTGINEAVQKQKNFEVEWKSRTYTDMRQRPLSKMRDEIYSSGKVSKETVKDYLNARGNLKTLEKDLERFAKEQGASKEEIQLMRTTASRSVSQMQKARDYMIMFGKE